MAGLLAAWQRAVPAEAQDVIALATAFRDPQAEARLRESTSSARRCGRCCTATVGPDL